MTKLMSWSAWLATRMMTRAMAPRSTQGRGEVRVLVLVLALVAALVHYDEGGPRSSSKEPRCPTSKSTSGTPADRVLYCSGCPSFTICCVLQHVAPSGWEANERRLRCVGQHGYHAEQGDCEERHPSHHCHEGVLRRRA